MQFDDIVEKTEEVRRTTKTRIEEIRQRNELTPEARRAQMAKEMVSCGEQLKALQGQLTDRVVQERRTLERRVWANPGGNSDPTGEAWRSALDRAEAIDQPERASALLERAERSGDEFLAKAIAVRAVDAWPRVAARYGQEHPEVAKAISDLGDF